MATDDNDAAVITYVNRQLDDARKQTTATTSTSTLSVNIPYEFGAIQAGAREAVMLVPDDHFRCPFPAAGKKEKKEKEVGVEAARIASGGGAYRGNQTTTGGRLGAKDGYGRTDEGKVSAQKKQGHIDKSGFAIKAMEREMVETLGMKDAPRLFNNQKFIERYGRVLSPGANSLKWFAVNLRRAIEHVESKDRKHAKKVAKLKAEKRALRAEVRTLKGEPNVDVEEEEDEEDEEDEDVEINEAEDNDEEVQDVEINEAEDNDEEDE